MNAEQSGAADTYVWTPAEAGKYSVRVVVTDAAGQKVASGWQSYTVDYEPLTLTSFTSDLASPQVANTSVTWTAVASGGTGALTYKFQTWQSGSPTVTTQQSGSANTYVWIPATFGKYGVRVVVTDATGQKVEGAWQTYTVNAPALTLTSLTSDLASPQVSGTPITWTAAGSGGAAPLTYTFQTWKSGSSVVTTVQSGSANTYVWTPATSGKYGVRVVVTDATGQKVEGAWQIYNVNP